MGQPGHRHESGAQSEQRQERDLHRVGRHRIATEESIKKKGTGPGPYPKLIGFLLPEIVVLLVALYFVLKPREGNTQDIYRYMRCPNCTQKLRFRKVQVGSVGACSRCKKPFLFPEGTLRETELDGAHKHEEFTEADD